MTPILPFGSGAVFCAAETVSKRCRGFALTYLAGLCASQAAAAAAFAEVVCEHSQLVDNGIAAHAVERLLAVNSLAVELDPVADGRPVCACRCGDALLPRGDLRV